MLKRLTIAILSVPALGILALGLTSNDLFGVGFGLSILAALAMWGIMR